MNISTTPTLCSTLGLALLFSGAASVSFAQETEIPAWSGYTFAPYGQIHLAYQAFDDGQQTTANIVDITNANSRVGFYLQPADGGNGLSFQFESGIGLRPSSKTSQLNTPEAWNWSRRDLRQVQFIHKGDFGKFRLGQGSMATDKVAQNDLGKTVVVAESTISEANGAYLFRTSTGSLSGITIGDSFDNFDGGRRFRLRYDSPSVQGFFVAMAYGIEVLTSGNDDNYYDLTLNYANQFGDIKVSGSIGTAYAQTTTSTDRTTAGSISFLDDRTGLNLSIAGGADANGNGQYYYLKAGWNKQFFDAGVTKLIFETYQGSDYVTNASRSRMWGVAVIQEFDAQRIEAYAGYRAFSYDDKTPTQYLDAGALQIGARVRF